MTKRVNMANIMLSGIVVYHFFHDYSTIHAYQFLVMDCIAQSCSLIHYYTPQLKRYNLVDVVRHVAAITYLLYLMYTHQMNVSIALYACILPYDIGMTDITDLRTLLTKTMRRYRII